MEEMFYTIIGPDGQMDYVWAETMFEAYEQGIEQFGEGTSVRLSWYKEWTCGMFKPGSRCGYDKYGNHIRAEEVVG
jgi:hypothetical protein